MGLGNILSENSFNDDNTSKQSFHKRKYEDIPVTEPQKRKSKNNLYKPPTVEEINNLKETENLYNNNLFRLQIEELMAEVNIKNKRKKELFNWIKKFESRLETLPEYEFSLSALQNYKGNSKLGKLLSKLKKFNPEFRTDQDVSIKLTKPACIKKFGLYEVNSLPGPNAVTKINLEMPKECFLTKDFLNNRYYMKRFYFLLYICENLREIATKVNLIYHDNNPLIPILEVEPLNCTKCFVLIYVTPAENIFKVSRFHCEQNNVKINLSNTNIDSDTLKISPTAFYNSSLAHDVTLSLNNDFIKETVNDLKNVQEGIKLLCIWLRQRDQNLGIISFSETLIVYFVVYLLQRRKINKFMSSYQVIRNFWNFIGNSNIQEEPISLTECTPEVKNAFKKHFDVVFLDKSGSFNLTAFLTTEIYVKIKNDCQTALKYLDANKSTSFHQLFLTKLPFHLQYDVIIDLTESLPLRNSFEITEKDKSLYFGYEYLLIVKHLMKTLQKAFCARISNIVPKLESDGKDLKKILLGINLNPEEAFNYLQKGPALNEFAAAAEFRKFWGHLSSDRRFRDGSTNVAVYFKTNTMKGRRNIIKKILEFILHEKLGLKYNLHYDEFEEALISKKVVPSYPSGTNEETTLKIIHASDNLGKQLRALEMSLKITGVQGISDVFTFTEVFPPIPASYKVCMYLFLIIKFCVHIVVFL